MIVSRTARLSFDGRDEDDANECARDIHRKPRLGDSNIGAFLR